MGRLRSWLSIDHISPAITLAAGALFLLRNGTNPEPSLGETQNMIIALLTLLAFDALTERIKTVRDLRDEMRQACTSIGTAVTDSRDQLNKAINDIPSRTVLRTRKDIELEAPSHKAYVITILAISAVNLLNGNYHLFVDYLQRSGTTLRFLLTDPTSQALEYHHAMDKLDNPPVQNIETANQKITQLQEIARSHNSTCEVRYLSNVLPYSLIMMQRRNDSDIMFVETHTYKVVFGVRPLITLLRSNDAKWYEFYEKQLEEAWKDATSLTK